MKAIIALLCLSAPAHAEGVCADHAVIVATLAEKYDEHQIALGAETRGPMVEIFASAAGTWTLVITDPSKRACLVAAGDGWIMAPMPIEGENG